MHHRQWLALLFAGTAFCLTTTARGESGSLAPLPANLTKIQKDTIFGHWTQFKYADADQSHSLSASVAQNKLTIATSSEEVFRSCTVKSESTYTVKIEDIISAKQFGKFIEIVARPNGITGHSTRHRIQDRTKTLLEDSHLTETKHCSDFSFSFEGTAQPEVLASSAAEDIDNYVKRKNSESPDPLLGKWEWGYYHGALAQWTTLAADGTATSTNHTTGHWRAVNELERIYEIKWDLHGWINVVHLSPDHNALVEDYYNRGQINSRKRSE